MSHTAPALRETATVLANWRILPWFFEGCARILRRDYDSPEAASKM